MARDILSSLDGRRAGISADGDWKIRGGMLQFKAKVVEITDHDYTISEHDSGCTLVFSSATPVIVTVPATLPRGVSLLLAQGTAATVRVIGSTVRNRAGSQYLGGYGAIGSLQIIDHDGNAILQGDTGDGLADVTGRATQTLTGVTQTAGGKVKATGSGSVSLATITQRAIGFNLNTPKSNGNADQTFATITQTARAIGATGGRATQTLSTVTQAAGGKALIKGNGSATLATITQVASDQSSSSTTYFISAAGSNSNNGTSIATPWLNITPLELITAVPGGLHPGDRIRFRGGDTFSMGSDGLYFAGHTGTAGAPIVIDSYGTGKAIITSANGSDCFGIWEERGAGFGNEYITIDNLIFEGSGYATTTTPGGIFIDSSSPVANVGLTITNCEFRYLNACITIGCDALGGTTDDIYVADCYFHDCRQHGFLTYGLETGGTLTSRRAQFTNILIENCWAETMGTEGISPQGCTNVEIRYCLARDTGKLRDGCVGIWTFQASNVWIHHCEADHCTTPASTDGDGFDFDGWVADSCIEYCYAHDNKGAGIMFFDTGGVSNAFIRNHMRYNLIVNNGATTAVYGDILLSGNGVAMPTNYVYNNTIIQQNAGRIAVRVNVNMQGRIGNNLVITDAATATYLYSSNTTESASLTVAGNAWYAKGANRSYRRNGTTYTTLAALQAVNTAFEKVGGVNVGYEVDPVLNAIASVPFGNLFTTAPTINQTLWDSKVAAAGFNIFQLQSGSPYKDAGRDFRTESSMTRANASADLYGNSVPAGTTWAIGAHDR